jgi:hypothetical protein
MSQNHKHIKNVYDITHCPPVVLGYDSVSEKGGSMAGNFNISVTRAGDHTRLRLNGDFDGSSACELVNLLSNGGLPGTSKILVDTDSVKHIHPFGLDVLHQRLSTATVRNIPLTFTGKLSTQFTLK